MTIFLLNFLNDEEGAVTVDWVVLTALVVALVAAAFSAINGGTSELALGIQTYLLGLLPGNL